MDLRRRTIRLSEENVIQLLQLPEGTQVRAVQSEFDPPSLLIGITHPDLSEVPADSEAPLAQWAGRYLPGGGLKIWFPELTGGVEPVSEDPQEG